MRKSIYRGRRSRSNNTKLILAIIAVVLAVLFAVGVVIFTLGRQNNGEASSSVASGDTTPTTTGKTLPKSFIDRNTASPYVILSDVTNNRVLYAKNADAKCYPASLTKLMTAIVALEYAPADTIFTVGNEIYMIDPQSSRAYLTVGTRLTMVNMLQAMLLPSGNDAAYSIAVQVGRRIAGNDQLDRNEALIVFCNKMNEKAAALGCTGTHFANPDGIDHPNHYTTAADMLKIATCALQNETIAAVVSTPSVTTTLLSGQTVNWKNSNRLIQENGAYSYAGATGLKTGSTDAAGYCLAASAQRDGKTCIAIVMGAKVERNRWEDAGGLLDISFQ
jgi:D-alanyl-D-alanine carboxypeptidase (penicillin-binding protein 5/6)